MRSKSPANSLPLGERCANLGSRPGAFVGNSPSWQDRCFGLVRREERGGSKSTPATQDEAVVVEDLAFRIQDTADWLGELRIDTQVLQGGGKLGECKSHVEFCRCVSAGVVQYTLIAGFRRGVVQLKRQGSLFALSALPYDSHAFRHTSAEICNSEP